MNRQPLKLRSAVITSAALTVGAAAGSIAETIAVHQGYPQLDVAPVAAACVTLWVLDKLNRLVEHDR